MNDNNDFQLPYFSEEESGNNRPVSGNGNRASKPKPRKSGNKDQNDKAKKYPLWKNVLAMIIVIALFIGAAYWATDIYTRHGEEVTMPDLKGLTERQAMDRLDALGLLGEVHDSIYTREIARGLICGQSIDAGNKVKQGRRVFLTINTDKAECLILPDVADNSSYREATARLKAMGFNLTQPEYVDGERDWVYSVKCNGRNVCAGTRIEINDPVTLVIGNGAYMMDEQEFLDTYGQDSIGVEQQILEIY